MTGYEFVEISTEEFSCSVEIRALNSRYLETSVNLPRAVKHEEFGIHDLLKQRFGRGKIELTVDLYDWKATRPVSINAALVKRYYRELKAIQKDLGIKEPVPLEAILSLDGVGQRDRPSISREGRRALHEAIERAIQGALDMRRREGSSIRKDMAAKAAAITKHMRRIKSLASRSVREKQALLRERIAALAGGSIDDPRLLTEIAIIADRLDVNEELQRLGDHLKKFSELLDADGQVGKQLDFLAQEMFREVNTIGSKSANAEIAHEVVGLKNLIEMIREQCRNVV